MKLVIQRTSDSVRSHSQKNDHAWSGSMADAGTRANTEFTSGGPVRATPGMPAVAAARSRAMALACAALRSQRSSSSRARTWAATNRALDGS